jgi:hypothetical protein
MSTNIFVPSKINVGFQNRKDTYTGKLAYVIYFDEKGKLRKENSWNSWRDKDIPNEIFDNEPTEGFVLNKDVGGSGGSGWDIRKAYTRIYDPRGFEFEITIPNLLWILENCNSIKGKGIEGEFVYGWDGKELVLVPVDSPDYKEIQMKSELRKNNEFIKAKDLVVGTTYETLKGEQYVYMGKHDVYEYKINRCLTRERWGGRSYLQNYKNYEYNKVEWDYDLNDSDYNWYEDSLCIYRQKSGYKNIGKQFWFIKLRDANHDYSRWNKNTPVYFKSVTRKFANIASNERYDYPELYELMESNSHFSPIDYNANKILPLTYENFVAEFERSNWWFVVGHMINDKFYFVKVKPSHCYTCEDNIKYCFTNEEGKDVYADSLSELYNLIQPVYGERYLANGKLNERIYYYDAE